MKKAIREKKLLWRKQLSSIKRDKHSRIICAMVLKELEIFKPKKILFYAAKENEVDLMYLFERITTSNKGGDWQPDLFFPRVSGVKEMVAVRVKDLQRDLFPGYKGIPEPKGTSECLHTELDAILVPGLSFNRSKHRIGYGGGFYDRFLQQVACKKIGVFYAAQEASFAPDPWDTPLDVVVTEKEIIS